MRIDVRGSFRGEAAASSRPRVLALLTAAILLVPALAQSVLISTGDGTGNTTAPAADPGFAHVGAIGGLSGVYFRNGWVLTASHVGEGPLVLDGVSYPPVLGSEVRFENADGTQADLVAFKLEQRPPLPDLEIASSPAFVGTLLTIIGKGNNRGDATVWDGIPGWEWTTGSAVRWGTNRIDQTGLFSIDTQAFRVAFDNLPGSPPGQHEADIISGDSGGAAFIGSGSSAELVGILFARASFANQPPNTSLYGNIGVIADLYAYRDAILDVTETPDCDDGLDDDGDGLIDDEDPGCTDPNDPSERGPDYACDNGLDDDGDMLFDFPEDDGCDAPIDPDEVPEPGFGLLLGAGAISLAGRRRRPRPASNKTQSTRSTR